MKTFQQKKESFNQIKNKLSDAKMSVFTGYAKTGEPGLTVGKIQELKKKLRANDVEYIVAKKTLIDKALKDSKIDSVDIYSFDGSLGVAFGKGEETSTAKIIHSFSRLNPALKLFGALLRDRFIDSKQFIELAKLPTREVMLGRAVGMIQYPIYGLVNALQGNIRKLVLTLSAIQNKK